MGTVLQDGRYLLLERIGEGGAGRVFRAFDRSAQRLVALKTARIGAPGGPCHPLASEFESWARLDHPNIVRALAMGIARRGPLAVDTPYLILELIEGDAADRALDGASDRVLVDVARQLLAGLAYVHEAGLVHRDLKPGNVLVRRTPRGATALLSDFGLALPLGIRRPAGTISGSLRYVSPEALLGGRLDERSDLYSLGVLLLGLVGGSRSLASGSARDALAWHLGAEAEREARRAASCGSLGPLISALTAREPTRRPRTAAAAARLLDGVEAAPASTTSGPAFDAARSVNDAERPLRPSTSERAALDAARLGAIRVVRLEPSASELTVRHDALRVWAQVRGVPVHGPPRANRAWLLAWSRVVSGLLHDDPRDGATALERHGLHRWLPLHAVGPVVMPDPARVSPGLGADGPPPTGAAAQLAGFLVERARRRSFVLFVEDGRTADPLADALVERLHRLAPHHPPAGAGDGGLVVFVAAVSRKPPQRVVRRAARPRSARATTT